MRRARLLMLAGMLLVLAAMLVGWTMVYVVDQRELAVVLQFGRPVVERTEPNIYFKLPLVQEVRRLPSTRQFWGDTPNDRLPDLPTKDDKKIEVRPWAVWRIREPIVFVQRMRTPENAEQRVEQFVRGAIRDVVTQYDLAELVRSTDRPLQTSAGQYTELDAPPEGDLGEGVATRRVKIRIEHGRGEILEQIKQEARRRLVAGSENEGGGRGIELIDVGISQIEFVASVRDKTFDRWIAERQAISSRNTNEGERMKQEILNRTAAEVQRIEGEGKRQSNEIRGKVDAQIIQDYAEAIREAGDFYTFVRTLEVYQNAITTDTKLILTTDSDLFGLFKRLDLDPGTTSSTPRVGRAQP